MISNTKESDVFFACCYRDDDAIQEGSPFASWLSSIDMYLSEKKLQNISKEGVNELVSETLHLFPRLTRSLSSALHQKTAGNPVRSCFLSCGYIANESLFILATF